MNEGARSPAGTPRVLTSVRLAALLLLGVAGALAGLTHFQVPFATDSEAYWQAAQRIGSGGELYSAWERANDPLVFRYSPWFAWMWVPLTVLPKTAVFVAWSACLAVAAAYVCIRSRELALVAAPVLAGAVWIGNVQPLMLAVVVVSVRRGAAGLGVGFAASLKLTPLAWALYFVGRRDWRQLAVCLGASVVLSAPFLLYDLSGYVTDPALTLSIAGYSQTAWAAVAVGVSIAALITAKTRFGWLGSTVAVLSWLPRLLPYDIAYLTVPVAVEREESASASDGRHA